jgi:nitroimidazol reductase NimA-like FMN-containing flavoprotein (pyridoxamine 5'-phosphate oxidase superfamily)
MKLLMRARFGHLGCAREGRPYFLPMHYAYDGKELYFYATQGMKTQFMNGNPQVSLQVKDILDSSHWRAK